MIRLSKPDLFVYVNSSEKLKGDSLTMKFVGYVSPYLVVTNGGRYTKHIYAGTQRIASKLGDIEAFGADPRRVAKAGHDVDGAEEIDFGKKYGDQNNAFTARFDSLGSKFNGKTLDDYVNGKSFCCNGNSIDEIKKNETNSAENAKLEDNLYFYHPDHLGSTNLITNFDGEVTQSVAYIPYGEVFVEERNGSWATPYLFNAKELDKETGLYYYGARYLDPTDCRWLAVDPVFHPGASPYAYCLGNPVKMVDPDGMDEIFYEEDGTEIGRIKKEEDIRYVMRTTQTTEEMYSEASEEQKGNSNPITKDEALQAKSIVFSACNNGEFSEDDIPMQLFVKIPNQATADASFDFIGDNGKGGTVPENNIEYGWNTAPTYDDNYKIIGTEIYNQTKSSSVGDPSRDSNISVESRINHTHPSGTNGSYMWQQPPSKTDIENASISKRVWGMRSRLIYIYDNNGVFATIPFSVYGK